MQKEHRYFGRESLYKLIVCEFFVHLYKVYNEKLYILINELLTK